MSCPYCEVKIDEKIYEDQRLIAFMPEKGVAAGHIVIVPKEHYRIFEEVPEEEVSYIFNIANKLSALVFDTLGVQGTNIIVHNGTPGQEIPHFSINVIPRTEGDGLDFQWEPQKQSEDDLEGNVLMLKEGLKEKKEKKKKDKDEPDIEKIEKKKGEDNYLIKQLDRMP